MAAAAEDEADDEDAEAGLLSPAKVQVVAEGKDLDLVWLTDFLAGVGFGLLSPSEAAMVEEEVDIGDEAVSSEDELEDRDEEEEVLLAAPPPLLPPLRLRPLRVVDDEEDESASLAALRLPAVTVPEDEAEEHVGDDDTEESVAAAAASAAAAVEEEETAEETAEGVWCLLAGLVTRPPCVTRCDEGLRERVGDMGIGKGVVEVAMASNSAAPGAVGADPPPNAAAAAGPLLDVLLRACLL
jgi:hypothetical protein